MRCSLFQPNPISLSRTTMNFARNSCVLANGIQRAVSNWWANCIPSTVLKLSARSARKLGYENVTREILISQLKRYYKFKLNNPRFCLDLLPTNEQKVLISEIAIPLPERTADGCRVILFNTGKQWNPKIITGDEIFRATILLMEATAIEAKTQVKVSSLSIFNLWNLYQNMSRTET